MTLEVGATAGSEVVDVTSLKTPNQSAKQWSVTSSVTSVNTINPIRQIVENIAATPNPNKQMIHLSLGDPTVFGNYEPPPEAIEGIVEAVQSGKSNGYAPSIGYKEAREAVAEFITAETAPVNADDICLACGCSDALNLAITVLANPGDNILMPRPGFSIYKTFCGSLGVEPRHYDCVPSRSWEVDIEHMTSLIDDKTRAIVVVNPSNPCGSNFSREHILDIIKVADQLKVPIIADEIYADMVFSGKSFHSVASLSENVPVLQCGGIAKRFLVPGWRCGWVAIHDRHNIFGSDIRKGLFRLSQRILGPCTLVQAALPHLIRKTPMSFHDVTMKKLEESALLVYEKLNEIEGLNPVKPEAAMYMMVGFDPVKFPDIKGDLKFTEMLISEQSVMCLPGSCFEYPNFFRLVLTVPQPLLIEACGRMAEFCSNHLQTP